MRLIEIGQRLKALRTTQGLTQAQLAALAGVTRSTVNRLENGTLNDLGTKKLLALLELVGAELVVTSRIPARKSDPVVRAVSAANVSSRGRLYADELIQALLTGVAPPHKAGHIQAALDELSADGIAALLRDLSENPARRMQMAQAARALAKVDAAERIADIILEEAV